MSRRISLVLAVLSVALLVPFLATAQQPEAQTFTFVALWNIPRAQWAEFTAFGDKNTRPVLDRLLADGTIVGYGNFASVVHTEEGYTHGSFWETTSLAEVERALGELLKLPPNPATLGARHRDHLFRNVSYRSRSTQATSPAMGGASGYLWVSVLQVQPGKAREWRELWDKYTKPTYDELQTNGTISGYWVEVEHVHTQNPGWRYIAYVAPSADAVDKVREAFAALERKRSPEENRAIGAAFADVIAPGSHWDFFGRVSNYAHK